MRYGPLFGRVCNWPFLPLGFRRGQVSAAATAGCARPSSPALVRASWSFDMSSCLSRAESSELAPASCRLCLLAYHGLLGSGRASSCWRREESSRAISWEFGHGLVHSRLALLALRWRARSVFCLAGCPVLVLGSCVCGGSCAAQRAHLAELHLRVPFWFLGRVQQGSRPWGLQVLCVSLWFLFRVCFVELLRMHGISPLTWAF